VQYGVVLEHILHFALSLLSPLPSQLPDSSFQLMDISIMPKCKFVYVALTSCRRVSGSGGYYCCRGIYVWLCPARG
jgi:hypothetical protein